MENELKYCPLSTNFCQCTNKCSWWEPIKEKCSIRVIGESLEKIKEMKERGK